MPKFSHVPLSRQTEDFFGFKLLNESIPLVSCFPSSVKSRTVLFSRLKGKFLAIKLVFDLNSIFLTEIFSGFFGVAPYFEFMPPLDLTFDFRRKLGRLGNSTFYEFSRVRNFSESDVNYKRKKMEIYDPAFRQVFSEFGAQKTVKHRIWAATDFCRFLCYSSSLVWIKIRGVFCSKSHSTKNPNPNLVYWSIFLEAEKIWKLSILIRIFGLGEFFGFGKCDFESQKKLVLAQKQILTLQKTIPWAIDWKIKLRTKNQNIEKLKNNIGYRKLLRYKRMIWDRRRTCRFWWSGT